jgi:CRISPR-associated protein Csh2
MTPLRGKKSSPNDHYDKQYAERSEFLFMYDTRMANPNGDPDENRPRIDPYSGRNLVTEYRLKRTIRDFIKNHYRNNKNDKILIREELNMDGTRQTFDQLAKLKDERKGKDAKQVRKELTTEHIDVRLFGLMFLYTQDKKKSKKAKGTKIPEKEGTESGNEERPQFKKLGPVQFAIGQSLNKVDEILIRNTRVVPTLEKGARSGTFGEKSILKYSLIVFHGFLNQITAKLDKDDPPLTEDDVMKMMLAMWHGTNELNTSSKFGQISRFLLRIVYSDELGYIGDLDKTVNLANSLVEKVSDISEVDIDVRKLLSTLDTYKDIIKKIQYACHNSLNVIAYEEKGPDIGGLKHKHFLGNVLEKWAQDNQKQYENILCIQLPQVQNQK